MPNPLQRRRMNTEPAATPVDTDEVTVLKKELEDLKAAYARDMESVSLDMRQLSLDLKEAKLNNGIKANPAA